MNTRRRFRRRMFARILRPFKIAGGILLALLVVGTIGNWPEGQTKQEKISAVLAEADNVEPPLPFEGPASITPADSSAWVQTDEVPWDGGVPMGIEYAVNTVSPSFPMDEEETQGDMIIFDLRDSTGAYVGAIIPEVLLVKETVPIGRETLLRLADGDSTRYRWVVPLADTTRVAPKFMVEPDSLFHAGDTRMI